MPQLTVADIYGTAQTGRDNSNAATNPTVNTAKTSQAQADATGSKGAGINYGSVALISFFGILLGFKFLEKRGK
jgi:hypothetical protein